MFIGAIVGDIIGSRFKLNNYLSKDFDLFTPDCTFTGNTVMMLAIAELLTFAKGHKGSLFLHTGAPYYLKKYGKLHPNVGYESQFSEWLFSTDDSQYNGFCSCAATRIIPAAFVYSNDSRPQGLLPLVDCITEVTHNHPEGLKGAEATAYCVWDALHGKSKEEIRAYITNDFYSLDFNLDSIRNTYCFSETCQNTVPQAIVAFLESTDFEDAIRNAISIGGDSATLACITGGIAGAFYGVPREFEEKAAEFLTPDLWNTVERFRSKYNLF